MLAVEELLCELAREEVNEQGLPPGFRFHPTDEELITFYLASKVFNGSFCGVDIAEVDLNRCEPWELPDVAKMGEREWYFFSLRDRKYPTGLRTNRATVAGYWKATGKDREVYSASNGALLGMKKTLVFYKGRAPRGEKTKWVMHEYRLDGDFSYRHTCKEEWVICRIFHKKGDKKSGLLQGQRYPMEAASSPTNSCLPPLLETQTTLMECQSQSQSSLQELQGQDPFQQLIPHQENDLKSLINPLIVNQQSHLFPMHDDEFQASTNNNNNNNPSPSPSSMLFKSLLSHQQASNTIPKQFKTESSFCHFQLPEANNLNWIDKIQQNPYQNQNPLFSEMDSTSGGSVLGFSATATATAADATTTVHDMSTSIAFNRAGFQMMIGPPIRLGGESWP